MKQASHNLRAWVGPGGLTEGGGTGMVNVPEPTSLMHSGAWTVSAEQMRGWVSRWVDGYIGAEERGSQLVRMLQA